MTVSGKPKAHGSDFSRAHDVVPICLSRTLCPLLTWPYYLALVSVVLTVAHVALWGPSTGRQKSGQADVDGSAPSFVATVPRLTGTRPSPEKKGHVKRKCLL